MDFAKFSTDELIELLAACGDDVPRRLAEAIVSRGAEALPWLCRLVSEERWWREGEGEGMLALHAMHLLGGIGDPSVASCPCCQGCPPEKHYPAFWGPCFRPGSSVSWAP